MSFDHAAPILVYIQCGEAGMLPISEEVAGVGRALALQSGAALYGLAIGAAPAPAELRGLGFDKVFVYAGEPYRFFDAESFGAAAVDCALHTSPSVFLFGSTPESKSFAPWAAARLHTGITADCTELSIQPDGLLLQTRPAFSGDLMAAILTPQTRPQMATIRQNVMPAPARIGELIPAFVMRSVPLPPSRLRLESAEAILSDPARISDRPLVMAIGAGLACREDIALFEALAARLGAALGSSRALVERGWMPPSTQIGLSGCSLGANTLLCLGVSGSIQFMSGIKRVKRIIAVNTDASAPIFRIANHGFVCDMYELARALLAK